MIDGNQKAKKAAYYESVQANPWAMTRSYYDPIREAEAQGFRRISPGEVDPLGGAVSAIISPEMSDHDIEMQMMRLQKQRAMENEKARSVWQKLQR
jgi:hypothetical protein